MLIHGFEFVGMSRIGEPFVLKCLLCGHSDVLIKHKRSPDKILGSTADILPKRIVIQEVKIAFNAPVLDCAVRILIVAVMENRLSTDEIACDAAN